MGKCRNKENDCHDGNCQEKHPKSCNKSPCESLKNDGWIFQWTTPEQPFVRSIIPGPFLRPKLVHALPHVLESNYRDCARRSGRKLRNGIPDPWLEYLAWKEKRFPEDARFCWEYMWLTDYVWNSRGLAMVQGIPDPWRVVLDCSCFDVDDGEVEETRKKPRRTRARDSGERVSRDLPRRDSKGKDDEKVEEEKKKVEEEKKKVEEEKKKAEEEEKKKVEEEEKKKKERNGYERVKDRMTELEDELRLRGAGNKRILRCGEKTAGSKEKTAKCKKAVDSEKPAKKVSPGTSKDDKGKAPRVSFDDVNDQIKRCNDDIAKIRKDAKLARDKIQKLKEKREPSRRKNSLCAGNCGRVFRNETILKSIKLNDDTSSSVASAREFLREINERIAITKNALNSPELHDEPRQPRERGAGDNPNEVIDLRQPSLFARRCDSEIPIDRGIPDRGDIVARCYRAESGRRNLRESEVLIVEAFSEQD